MAIRGILLRALAGAAVLLAGCDGPQSGPVTVSAIGGNPELADPNRQPPDPADAFLLEASAQGLVRFDATGQIEPALAQSWTVSDDGLSYTFRIARGTWSDGTPITAAQVVGRLRAAMARRSRNRAKPVLGAIAEIERMTDAVLVITLKSPRPHFLQLLAQPDMAIIRNGAGSGPYRAAAEGGTIMLEQPGSEDEGEADLDERLPDLVLRGESAARAVARFAEGEADLVTGGAAGDLALARAARLPTAALRFDPVNGLFGLAIGNTSGPLRDRAVRRALSMAVDRRAIVAALRVPDLQPRDSIVPPAIPELPSAARPDWSADPLPIRRTRAAQAIAAAAGDEPLTVRVAVPDGPGHRLIFAHLRRDWRAIGVTAEAVGEDAKADLRMIDAVAPASIASWYLRQFTCAASAVCSAEADAALEAARNARTAEERRTQLAAADRLITDATAFIAISAPVRWSLVSQRVTGFQPNPSGRRFPGSLVAQRR